MGPRGRSYGHAAQSPSTSFASLWESFAGIFNYGNSGSEVKILSLHADTRAAGAHYRSAAAATAKITKIAPVRRIMIQPFSKGKPYLRRQALGRRLVPHRGVVILQLERHRLAGIIAHAGRGTGAKTHIREYRFLIRGVDVLVADVRPIRAKPPGKSGCRTPVSQTRVRGPLGRGEPPMLRSTTRS